MNIRLVISQDYDVLVPLLHDADEDDDRIRRLIEDGAHISYLVYDESLLVGALVMRWITDMPGECEIEYIAIVQEYRGCGYGRVTIAALFAEAQRRDKASILVGTDNTALRTLAFYMRCGFRMDHVRPDFFSYIQPLLIIDGMRMQDMLVLRYRLHE